jgi:hypothetical protein
MTALGLGLAIPFRRNAPGAVVVAAPSALTSQYVSETAIDLAWTKSPDCDGHKVWISTDNITFTLHDDTLTASQELYHATGLTTDESYYFYITADKGGVDSARSNKVIEFTYAIANTPAFALPEESDYITRVGSSDMIWWHKLYSRTNYGSEESSGVTQANQVYIITATTADYFYTGCQVDDIFVGSPSSIKTLTVNCKVKKALCSVGDAITDSSVTALGTAYEILTVSADPYFYAGNKVGQIFACTAAIAGKTINAENSLREVLSSHMGQGVAANRPTIASPDVDGVTIFDGSNDFIESVPFTLKQPFAIYAIVCQKGWTFNDALLGGSTNGYINLIQGPTGESPSILIEGGVTGTIKNTQLVLGEYHVLRWLMNGSSTKLIIDNGTPSTGVGGTRFMSRLVVGARGGDAAWANCAYKVLIARNTADLIVHDKIFRHLVSKLPAKAPSLSATVYRYNQINLTTTITTLEYTGCSWERSLNGIDWTVMGTTGEGGSAYSAIGLDASTLYYFRCRTYSGETFHDYSAVIQATTFAHAVVITFNPETPIKVNYLIVGLTYTILTAGTTNWVLLGADNSEVGTVFTATAVGDADSNATATTKDFKLPSLTITTGITLNIDWGDSTNVDKSGSNSNIIKSFATTTPKVITINGDVDRISYFQLYAQANVGIDYSLINLPADCAIWHCYDIQGSGSIAHLIFPDNLQIFHIGRSGVPNNTTGGCTGDISGWVFKSKMRDMHIECNPSLTGDISTWDINVLGSTLSPANGGHLYLDKTGVIADISSWRFPEGLGLLQMNNVAVSGNLSLANINGAPVGDLSIGAADSFNAGKPDFTHFPRGEFKYLNSLNFLNNSCNSDEINLMLHDLDIYFASNTPLFSCVYNFSGTGMGTPDEAGLVHRANIITVYEAAGKSCTITVN